MTERHEILLSIYKDARETVRHFDVILSNFRKIAFAFNSTVVTGYIASIFNEPLKKQLESYWLAIWLIALVFNYLLWFLEKHYHKYLLFSAQVAKNIESELSVETRYSLSERIYYASTTKGPYIARFFHQIKRFFNIQYYDTIYLFPILAVNGAAYFYAPKKTLFSVLITVVIEAWFIIYLLAYDKEVRRKLKDKIKMGGIEKFFKKSPKKAISFAKKCLRIRCNGKQLLFGKG